MRCYGDKTVHTKSIQKDNKIMRYYLPFLYTFFYNRKGLDGIAYFLEYCGALFVLVWLCGDGVTEIFLFFGALSAYMTLYEIGYLENNVIAIKNEQHPTLRHTEQELIYLEQNYPKIIRIRYALVVILTALMAFWIDVVPFISLLVLSRIIFYLYNMKYREGLVHRLLFMALRFLRYVSPVWFLGLPALFFAGVVSLVNLINNFAWYDRWGVHLPRFFGTKLFDGLVYATLFLLFYQFENQRMVWLFLYMAIIKFILFSIVLLQKKVFCHV